MKTLIVESDRKPIFKDLECHGTSISTDWFGKTVKHPPRFLFWLDQNSFHFLVQQKESGVYPHPTSQEGVFQAELWKYDVAEFFLQSRDRSRYLEFNLSPSGGWWSCVFGAPLEPEPGQPRPFPGVVVSAVLDDRGWKASASFSRSSLEEQFPIGPEIRLNAAFILQSPRQIFLTAGNLGGGIPNFHQPDRFPGIKLSPLT